ncbi:MAG: zinc ribbon domain-containing protein, partial [Chloroflexi bacterium]
MTEHRTAADPPTTVDNGEVRPPTKETFSERLLTLLDDILAGGAPNAGRFCGYCYHPLAHDRQTCAHCGRPVAEWPTVAAVPRPVIEMHRRRRGREGLVVRTVAWGGLSIGVI